MRGTTNWNVIEDQRVRSTVRRAAKSLADMNQGVVEAEDMYQEGLLLTATVPKIASYANEGDYGLVYNMVRERLFTTFIRPLDRSGELHTRKYKSIPVEDADESAPAYVVFDDGTGDYTEDAVRLLLPAVWDESYAYGLPAREDSPDHDMPKAASNKARGNSHWAYIADIKTGWTETPLTLNERRAVFLSYAMGWSQRDIAFNQGVDQKTVSRRVDSAVKKITARLNGAGITEEEI